MPGLVCHDFKCRTCGRVWEDIVDRDTVDAVTCECGGPADVYLGGHTDRFSQNLYPYFDRGLGCVVESPAHRRDVCKRLGVVPVDGDYDIGRDLGVAAERARGDDEIAACEQYEHEIEHAPWFAEYRRLRDRGAYDNLDFNR